MTFPLSGLVLYLPLWHPELSGATIISKDLNAYSCTVIGAVHSPNVGRVMDGDDYVDIDSALASLAATTTGTIIVWVKIPDATPAAAMTLVAFGDTNANERVLFDITSQGLLRAVVNDAGENTWLLDTDAAVFSDDTWACVAVVHNGTQATLFANGAQPDQAFSAIWLGSKTKWFSQLTGLDNGRIGCENYNNGDNTGFLTGTIGEVWMSTKAITLAEYQRFRQGTKWRYQ